MLRFCRTDDSDTMYPLPPLSGPRISYDVRSGRRVISGVSLFFIFPANSRRFLWAWIDEEVSFSYVHGIVKLSRNNTACVFHDKGDAHFGGRRRSLVPIRPEATGYSLVYFDNAKTHGIGAV